MVDGFCVHPVIVHLVWPQVKHLIKRAMERGDMGVEKIEADVLSGRAILWLAVEREILGAAITNIDETERVRACVIRACGGTQFRKWGGLISVIEEYARQCGCAKVRFGGRRGWERLIKGYTLKRVIMERTL